MKRTMFFGWVAASMVMVMTSCGQPRSQKQGSGFADEDTGAAAAKGSLVTSPLSMGSNDTQVDVRFSLDFPVKGNAVLLDSVRQFMAETITADPEVKDDGETMLTQALAGKYSEMKHDHDSWQADVDVTIPPVSYSCDIKLIAQSDAFVTFSVDVEDYEGGAHGTGISAGISFSQTDGRKLGYNLLQHTNSLSFKSLIKEGLRTYFSYDEQVPYDEQVLISDEELNKYLMVEGGLARLPLPSFDPWLTKEGVAFCYQEYEIASYGDGRPKFTISWDKIRPFLSREARELLKK